jgi:hypothetical protein
MSDPIIEAAARALFGRGDEEYTEYQRLLARAIVAAVTPLIRAAALEQALEIVESCALNADGDYIIERIRALQKKQP